MAYAFMRRKTTLSEFNDKFGDFMLVMTVMNVVIRTGFVVHRYCLVKFCCYVRTVRTFYVATI